MTLDLYLDHDPGDSRLVDALRSPGINVLTSRDAGNERAPDEEQLAFAAAARRVLYTSNARDFDRLHYEWVAAGRTHAGVVIRAHHDTTVGFQIQGLTTVCTVLTAAEVSSRVIYLESWLRRR